ncbi:uncharacterized protein LOC135108501 [Scylla paramamosain]|uniref:uncharacterized protein LOC135108501 n=1 Tax=Scylla paramamosain TaxID=85552 RepID=UPI003082F103
MPESRGEGQYESPHAAPNYQTIGSEVKMAHSGAWVGCEGPGDAEAQVVGPAHGEASWIRTSEVRKQGQFVTVVEVEKDGEETGDTTGHAWRATSQPVPRPAPRGFVTVVAVGTNTDTSLHLDHSSNLAFESNVKLHMEHPAPPDADYVNQETIDRERKAAEEMEKETPSASSVPDQVVVYRLPGERLGLGLKFDGGVGAQECVRRLFIQSVAPDSPAARAAVPWGELNPGDQILNIEGCAVSSMTRVQCVSFLKDAAMKITIGVLKGNGQLPDLDTCTAKSQEYCKEEQEAYNNGSAHPPPLIVGEMRKRMPPPPLPPRARPRKSPARPPKDPLPPPPSGFQDYEDELPSPKLAGRSRSEDKDHPEWRELLSRRGRSGDLEELLEDLEFHLPSSWAAKRLEESVERGLPPRPTFYLDLLGEEDAAGPCESESDETSSSVSTVIDRLSLSSSTTVSRNSSFNATADAARFDLARALSPFEQLEKELETEVSAEAQPATPAAAPRDEVATAPPVDRSTKPVTEASVESPSVVETEQTTATEKTQTPKTKTRSSIKSFALSLKGRPFSWQQGKNASERAERGGGNRGESFLSIKRPGKRPAPPPPPPPRSVAGGISHAISLPCTTSATTTTAGVKETIISTDSNGNVPGNDDSYIDLVAEAAEEGNMNKSLSLKRNKLERQTAIDLATEDESSDLSLFPQNEVSKTEPEYLVLLDSPSSAKGPDDAHDERSCAKDDKQEKDECNKEQDFKDLSEQLESSASSDGSQTRLLKQITVSQASPDNDTTSAISKKVNVSAHEEDHVLTISSNYIETCAEVHHSQEGPSTAINKEEGSMPSLSTLSVSHQETKGQRGEETVAGGDVEASTEQDAHGEVEGNIKFYDSGFREGNEGEERCDNVKLDNTASLEDDNHNKGADDLCEEMDVSTDSYDTLSATDVAVKHTPVTENYTDGNRNVVQVNDNKESDEYVRLSVTKTDYVLVSENTKEETGGNSGDVNMNTIEESSGNDDRTAEGTKINSSTIEYSTVSESSRVEIGTHYEDEEHLEREAVDGSLEETEEDQNIYEEIDETPCTEDQDQDLDGYYSCSSRKHSTEHSPRDLPGNITMKEDPELYDDVAGLPDQSGSESQDSSDLQGLKLSGPEEEGGEQDTIDEDSESLYDDVVEDHVEGMEERGSENVYENLEESEVVEDNVDQSVVSGEEKKSLDTRDSGGSCSVKTVTECVRHRRLRQDIGDLIRREMNLDDNVTVEVEEEEEVESTVECENEEELLLVMRALRSDQPGDSLRWLEDDSDEDDNAGAADGDKEGKEEGESEKEERGQDPARECG